MVYELVNNLSGEYKEVRAESAKALWALESAGLAIRSLKDEFQYPSHMTSQEALDGIETLKNYAKDEDGWKDLYKENWEDY